jgi:hypothetical protein
MLREPAVATGVNLPLKLNGGIPKTQDGCRLISGEEVA